MDANVAESRLFAVLASVMNVAPSTLTLETSRTSLEAWDSLKHMYLMLALEEEFGIEFSDAQIASLASASALLAAIVAKLARQPE
jgi:acyl carrier protein